MMSLDKQRILNELGSVMHQLQSANCGCMGRLFRNPNTNWNGNGNTMAGQPNNHFSCCQNQNSPNFAGYSGFSGQNSSMSMGGGNLSSSHVGNSHMGGGNMRGSNLGGMNMGGMNMGAMPMSSGHNPVKLYSDTYKHLNQNLVQPTIQEVYDDLRTMTPENTVMNNSNTPQMSNAPNPTNDQMAGTGMSGMGQNIVNMMTSSSRQAGKTVGELPAPDGSMPVMNPVMDPNNRAMMPISHQQMATPQQIQPAQVGNVTANVTQNNIQAYPTQMPTQNTHKHADGQNHAESLAKFNQMLPGVTNKFRDLGFDPMSIALQMNPQNPNGGPSAAEASMKRILENNAKAARLQPTGLQPLAVQQGSVQQPGGLSQPGGLQQAELQQAGRIPQTGGVQSDYNAGGNYTQPMTQSLVQEVYNANVEPQNPNQGLTGLDNTYKNELEPIHPVNVTKNIPNQFPKTNTQRYNTMGRPVDVYQSEIYRTKEENIPQTLSPQLRHSNYSNVRCRASKTSLLDQHLRRASKTQLQEIYNRYKEPHSHSDTQQNVQPTIRIPTHSDNRLNDMNKKIAHLPPIEKVGGDTLANVRVESNKLADGALNKPNVNHFTHGRNGLQDIVYISSRSKPAWTFHG